MTKKSKKSRSAKHRLPVYRRPVVWAILGITLVVVAFVVFIIMRLVNPAKPENSLVVTNQHGTNVSTPAPDVEVKDEVQNSAIQNASDRDTYSNAVQYEGTDPNTLPTLTGIITASYVSGGNLIIIASIDQFLTSGTCALTLSQSSRNVYSTSVSIDHAVTSSTCAPISIPLSSLHGGKYNISIVLSSGGRTGLITGEAEV